MDFRKYRKELKDFIGMSVKAAYKPSQEQAKYLLKLSDDDLNRWIKENNAPSFMEYALNRQREKEDALKYSRLKRKSEDWDFEEFSEEETEFIEIYEEDHNINDSIL